MKRPRIAHFAILMLSSMLLLTITSWAISYWHTSSIYRRRTSDLTYFLVSHRGRIAFIRQTEFSNTSQVPVLGTIVINGNPTVKLSGGGGILTSDRLVVKMDPHQPNRQFMGFGHWRQTVPVAGNSSPGMETLTIPHWFISLLLATPLAIILRRWNIRRKQNMLGMCRVCGYDLRATPDRCPECGTECHRGGAEAAEMDAEKRR